MINYIKLVLVIAISFVFCYIVWDYQVTKTENKRLLTQVRAANSTIAALDNIMKKNREIEWKRDTLVDEIDKEPETNDAPTAPVLLNSIKRLH